MLRMTLELILLIPIPMVMEYEMEKTSYPKTQMRTLTVTRMELVTTKIRTMIMMVHWTLKKL